MLKVGIHEDIKFSTSINDKGTLIITLTKVKPVEEGDDDLGLNEVTIESDGDETQNFMIFPLQTKGFENKELVEVRSLKPIVEDIKDFRTLLTYILTQYTTLDEIVWDIYANSDITTENQKEKLVTAEGLKVVYDNLSQQFVEQFQKVKDDNKLFRVILVRTSKKSHYPKLRNKYLSTTPFMEPMDIPKEQSKLAFTKSEIAAGLDNGDPVVADQSAEDKDLSSLTDAGL